ncbi:MAG: hypothetical protein LBQ73_05240 [Tannerellaceae bacterium]|jgi:hypothetical protein|nr:hypothetical protein [Tannerellaceae bacterium]
MKLYGEIFNSGLKDCLASIVDNTGKSYTDNYSPRHYNSHISQTLNGHKDHESGYIGDVDLPNGITVTGEYTIRGVNPAAKFFQIVRIALRSNDGPDVYGVNNFLAFYNLPIYTLADVTE